MLAEPNSKPYTLHVKKKPIHDPFASREASKYEHPIPSREYILQILEELAKPIAFNQLAKRLHLDSEEEATALNFRLKAMLRDGQLFTDRRGRFGLVGKMQLIAGRVIGHADGFGFVSPDEGKDDLYLSPKEMRKVFHGDRVLVREAGVDRRGRREGMIHEVLARNTHTLVGRVYEDSDLIFVEPQNKRIAKDILVSKEAIGKAKPDDLVVVEITTQPDKDTRPKGVIKEVLGPHVLPGMEIDIALHNYALPFDWPDAVHDEIKGVPTEVQAADQTGRTDLRDLPFVTIDGEDAKDFDDAVYCKPEPQGGWILWVAIADVSHYVGKGTALDEEAISRGNSVYFPGRVIPMLPEVLSNGLCSLKPEVDRLAMVCEMRIDAKGNLDRFRFFRAVIRSQARLTYHEVFKALTSRQAANVWRHRKLLTHITQLHQLYKVLYTTREKRGAIEFDTVETRILFNAKRRIRRIIAVERNDAHKIIEECMLAANVSAARFIQQNKLPCLFRIHAPPTAEKLENLRAFLSEFGLGLAGGKQPRPADYRQLIEKIHPRADFHLLQTVLLRSLLQAEYNINNVGHFGLSYEAYTHFTSPIRRYPDLLVHRTIGHILDQGDPNAFAYQPNQMAQLARHCSDTERRADDATEDVTDWLKCEFMLDKVGSVYSGVISSVTNFGIFVELDKIFVSGLVHITALENDYYLFDPIKHQLVGQHNKKCFRLGDQLRVQVNRVDLDDRKIDFELA